MNDIVELDGASSSIDFDPVFSEIEFILSEYENHADPLEDNENTHNINWYTIRTQSDYLLKKCFDLRVLIWSMRASLQIEGVSALYKSVETIEKRFSEEGQFTSSVENLNQSTENSYAMELSWLATSDCLQEIKNSRIYTELPLTVDELLQNIHADAWEGRSLHLSELVKSLGLVDEYFSSHELLSLTEQLVYASAAIERIENYANFKSPDYRLDCQRLRDYLGILSHQLELLKQPELPIEADGKDTDIPGADNVAVLSDKCIRSRKDVIMLLDQVLGYFKTFEPSHPAPILIRRSQKMIGMDFATIVEELLPESLPSLNQISGK